MIGIVDYGLGNIASLTAALTRVKAEFIVCESAHELRSVDKLILPGVGAFGDGMNRLRQKHFEATIKQKVLEYNCPILGICLGFQMLANRSHEHGCHEGLGLIAGEVKLLRKTTSLIRIPHMGWNECKVVKHTPLFNRIGGNSVFYYVHSYVLTSAADSCVTGICDYGDSFPVTIQHENIYGVQFHPEKSQLDGLKLLKNFAENC